MDQPILRLLIQEKLADGRLPPGPFPSLRGRPGNGETCEVPGTVTSADRPGRPGVDAARQPAHRQHPAAGHQPAARPAVGQAAADPAAPALRRHPLLRLAGRLQRQPGPVRPRAAGGLRRCRVRDPALRHTGAAADPRRDPRAADGAQAARGAGPVRRRPQWPVQRGPRDLRLRAHRARDRAADRARPAAQVPRQCPRRTRWRRSSR